MIDNDVLLFSATKEETPFTLLSVFDECLAQLLKEELQAVLGLLEQTDVVTVLSTSFGKSLIYQLFAAVKLCTLREWDNWSELSRYY